MVLLVSSMRVDSDMTEFCGFLFLNDFQTIFHRVRRKHLLGNPNALQNIVCTLDCY